MKIRKLIIPFVSGLVLLLVGACSENEQGVASPDGIVLRFAPVGSTRTTGSTDPGTDAENKIDNVAIWCYPDHATDDAVPLYYEKLTGVNLTSEASILLTEKKLGDANMSVSGTYDIYVAANLPMEATVGDNVTLGDLKKYSYTVTSRPGSPFSMSGNGIGCDFSKESEVKIPLFRHAVKLGLTLVNETSSAAWTINSVKIRNDQKTLQLFEPTASPSSDAFTTDLTVSGTPTSTVFPTYSTYINENLSNVPTVIEVDATVGAENKKYVAEIMPDGAAKLVRNSLCNVTLRLKDAIAKIDVESSLVPWEDSPMNEPIEQLYLEIDKSNLNVDLITGEEIIIKSNVIKVHVDLTHADGFILEGYEDKRNVDIPLSDKMGILTFRCQLGGTITNGVVNITAGNLTRVVNLTKVESGAFFELQTFNIANIGGLDEIENKTLPWHLGDPLNQTPQFTMIVARNVRWFCRIAVYYDGDGFNIYDDIKDEHYNGVNTQIIEPSIPVNFDSDRIMHVVYSLGIGDPTAVNIVLREIKFSVAPYNP